MRGSRCHTLLGAVTNNKIAHGTKIPVFKFNRIWSEINTIDKKTAEFYRKNQGFSFKEEKIDLIDISTLLSEIGKVNFINIDIEGMDEIVIRGINFQKNSPEVIVFEDNFNIGGSKFSQNFLKRNGYERLFISGGSVGYFKKIKH